MDIKNIIASISYLEYVNKIDSLCNELLYANNSGYIYAKSKEAIIKRNEILERFSYEVDKIKNETGLQSEKSFISRKKEEFVKLLNKHYYSQIPIWIDDVYVELIKNCFFELSMEKDRAHEIYLKVLNAINWYAQIKELNANELNEIKNSVDEEFQKILNDFGSDYVNTSVDCQTDYKVFLKLWDILLSDYKSFLNFDFKSAELKLSQQDYNYFNNLKSKLVSYKKESVLDEVLLINTSANIAGFENEEKYNYIKSINNDFICYLEKNKTITEAEMIKIIKRRIELHKELSNPESNYYRKLICSENR